MLEATRKMIERIKWFNQSQIQQKIQEEYSSWKSLADKKRPILKEYLLDYNISWESMKKGQHVKSKSLFTYRNLMVSTLYKNKPIITFEGRKQWDKEYADTWNNLLKFDYEELWEDKISYNKIGNTVDYGIYLAVDEGRDTTTQSPRKRLYSPMCWIPDPYFTITWGFNFHWFELELVEWDLNKLYSNTDFMLTDKELKQIKEKTGDNYSANLNSWANWYWMSYPLETINSPLKTYSVYRHFTKFNNQWYLTEWANERTLLLRCEQIKAVREEEKKDGSNIPCPVVHSWLMPKEWDPYGICIGDLARDNQKSEEQVLNLLIDKIHEDTFSWITIYDPAYIDWGELAKKRIGKRKYLPAKRPINGQAIENIQTQTSSTSDWYNLKNIIDQKSKKEIGFDEQSIGVYSQTITATQSQLLQNNQNVRLSTIFKIFLRGEKNYWDVLRYRSYQKNFKMDSEKNIVLNSWIGDITYTIKGKDLNTKKDLHLKIVSIIDTKEKEEKNKGAMMAAYQPLMQQASNFGKIELTKQFAKMVGMDKELINMVYDYPKEYHQAMLDIELLNENEDVADITDMNEDHSIYIQIYQKALDTKAKERAIAKRKQALLLSKQQPQQQAMAQMQQWWWGQNASTNQLISNYISEENQKNSQPTSLWTNTEDNGAM